MWDILAPFFNGLQMFSVSSAVTVAIIYVAFYIAISIDCWRHKGDFLPEPHTPRGRKRLAWITWALFLSVTAVVFIYFR